MIFTENISVDAHDTDAYREARPASLLRMMQSAVNTQMHTYRPSYEELYDMGQAFILSRIAVRFFRPVAAHDSLSVSTWSCDSRGFSFNRCYTVKKGDELIADATSIWALTDIQTKKLCRVESYKASYTNDPPLPDSAPLRFTLPEEMLDVGFHTVHYNEIDQNHHMNNVRYLDLICNFLDMRQKRLKSASITFVNEAPEYSRIRVTRAENGNEVYFRTYREDGKVNIEAYVVLQDRA